MFSILNNSHVDCFYLFRKLMIEKVDNFIEKLSK